MVLITEILPKKVSGPTSLWVQFRYDPALVELCKAAPGSCFHKRESAWEVPLSSAKDLLDRMCLVDSIELRAMPDREERRGEPASTPEEIASLKAKPFKHQVDAIDYGLEKKKYLLLDGMGLGKTNEIIWTAEILKKRGLIDHCLVICGVDSLRQNWKKEVQKFSSGGARVLGEKVSKKGDISYKSVAERAKELEGPIEELFVIVNIAAVRDDKIVEAFQKASKSSKWMVAVDECHRTNNKGSQQGANLLKIDADWKIAATGTPITNSPVSAYLPLYWVGADKSTLTNFKSLYCKFGGFNGYQVVGFKNLDFLREEIESCSLRRTMEEVREDMPPKTIEVEEIEMSDKHKKFYNAVKDGVKEEVDKIELSTANLLTLTIRLRQASSCPSLLTSEDIDSSKADRIEEIVEDLVESGEKVVVMCCFIQSVRDVAAKLDRFRPLVCTGEVKEAAISANVDKFQNDPEAKVIVCSIDKMGTGYTLNAAKYMLMIDEDWTAYKNSQAHDRIWRVNNTMPAFIKVLVNKGTIDEKVHLVSQKKQDLQDYLVDGDESKLGPSLRDDMIDALRSL